jgi:hypothetical protein
MIWRRNFVIFLSFFVCCKQGFSEELSKTVSSIEKLIIQFERQLIAEQSEFKNFTRKTINCTASLINQIQKNSDLKKLFSSLNILYNIHLQIVGSNSFRLSSFDTVNTTTCKKSCLMVKKLEEDINNYVFAKKEAELNTLMITRRTNELKLEYMANYINLKKSLNESVLHVISKNEKLADKSKQFSTDIHSISFQIANNLYELKLAKFNGCDSVTPNLRINAAPTVSAMTTITSEEEEDE